MDKSTPLQSASIRQENQIFFVQGTLNAETVVDLNREGVNLILQTQNKKINFDLKDVIIKDASPIAMLLEWIKVAKTYDHTIVFSHIPERLIAIAELGGVNKIIQNMTDKNRN